MEWREIADDGFIGLVGPIEIGTIDAGSGTFRFRAETKHRNLRGVVQGGMLMTFADRALGMTARYEDGGPLATVQLDVHFMDRVEIGETVEIACSVMKRTRSLIFMEGKLTAEGRLVASAKGTWKRLRPAAP